MSPIEALMFALVDRFAAEFVPEPLRGEFQTGVDEAQRIIANDRQLADWVGKKTARIDTWQGVLDPPQPENELWPTVSAALFNEQNLAISYRAEKGETRHEVRPLAVVKRDEVLYLVVRYRGHDDARLLPVHRIVRAAAVDTTPEPPGEPFDLATLVKNGLPFVLPGAGEFDLHLRLKESAYRSIVGRPLRNTSSISQPVDGWFEVEAKGVPNTIELRWWLLGFGDKVRILEPEPLARELQYLLFDPLTGLVARRTCREHLARMIAAARRTAKPVSVLMVDIDRFKSINDHFGHSAGDKALQEVSSRLKTACRSMDVVGRWGGEEFLILLPETTIAEAALLAERLRQEVASTPCGIDDRGALHEVTVSIGVTSTQALAPEMVCHDEQIDALVGQADRAMYEAKTMRNRSTVFADATSVPATAS